MRDMCGGKSKLSPFVSCLLAIVVLCSGCEKYRLDQKVKELCAKDGGIKVYETVTLPADKFNQWGQPNFFEPTQGENALGPEYIYKVQTHYYREGRPSMSRTHYQIFRRADKKLLGETVLYSRGGGDIPSPIHDSHFTCPDANEAGDVQLRVSVFTKE